MPTRSKVALAFGLGTLLLPLDLTLLVIYVVNVATASFSQFANPAELALLPDYVDRSLLMSANSFMQLGLLVAEGVSQHLVQKAVKVKCVARLQ